jgi:integrase
MTPKVKKRKASVPPFNFMVRALEALPTPRRGVATFHDSTVRSLGLYVKPSGKRSFYWFRKVREDGRSRGKWKTLGDFPTLTIEQARDAARELDGDLSKLKRDALPDSAERFGQRRGGITFGELLEAYVERHGPKTKRPEKFARDARSSAARFLPGWAARKAADITSADVLNLHDALGRAGRRYAANRTVQLLRAVFNWGAGKPKLFFGKNPAVDIELYPETKRRRFLEAAEFARLGTALRTEANPDLRDFVELSLWTGARKMDTLRMQWTDVFLKDNRWDVPDPKGDPYSVPLTPEAVEILTRRQGEQRPGTVWVFPGPGKAGHVMDLKKGWSALLRRAGIAGLRQHDLRRTMGSIQANQGASLQIIGASLGHKTLSTTRDVYAQLQLAAVRASMETANRTMGRAMALPETATVARK